MDVEHQCNQFAAAIKEKRSAGVLVPEADYQKLYELNIEGESGWPPSLKRWKPMKRVPLAARPPVPEHGADKLPVAPRRLLRREVGPEEIAEVVRTWTGIPVSRVMETERAKLLVLEDRIHQRLVGRAGPSRPSPTPSAATAPACKTPIGPSAPSSSSAPPAWARPNSARPSAEVMFDNENAMIRLDMSEFIKRHTVSRLIGKPPGYVGYEEGGCSPKPSVAGPTPVILFD